MERYKLARDAHPHTTEKTIHDEEVSNVDVAESMAELKVVAITSKADDSVLLTFIAE